MVDEVERKNKNKRIPFVMPDESSGSESEADENQDLDYLLNKNENRVRNVTSTYEDWLDEIDRVAPNLKSVARLETKDWRARLDQISSYQTKPKLTRLEKELSKTIDTVESRQKYINNQLSI